MHWDSKGHLVTKIDTSFPLSIQQLLKSGFEILSVKHSNFSFPNGLFFLHTFFRNWVKFE